MPKYESSGISNQQTNNYYESGQVCTCIYTIKEYLHWKVNTVVGSDRSLTINNCFLAIDETSPNMACFDNQQHLQFKPIYLANYM